MSCFWLIILLCNAAVQGYLLSEAPVDMIIAENVYVLTTCCVTKFDRNLSLLSETSLQFLKSSNLRRDALKMAIKDDEKELLVCFAFGKCFLFDTMDYLTDDNEPSANFVSSSDILLSSIQANTFYIAQQATDEMTRSRFIELNQYAIKESSFQYTEYADEEYDQYITSQIHQIPSSPLKISNLSFLHRNFVHTFRQNSYVYFVGLDEFSNSTLKIFLMRVCDKQNNATTADYNVYEIYLFCGFLSPRTHIIGILVADNTMLVDLHEEPSYTKQCVFNITEIDSAMDSTYDLCLNRNYDNPLPWASPPNRHNCNTRSQMTMSRCNFGSFNQGSEYLVPALAVSSAAQGQITMELWNYSTNVSLTILSRSVVISYLGASNSTGHYLLKYYRDASGTLTLMEEYRYSSPVQILRQKKDVIYVATTTDVLQYQIFSTCSQYHSCASCTSLKDPFCGWCVVENKCSTAEQCYSPELAGRWIISHEQCIVSVSLSSMYVALDNISQISFVTVPLTSVFPRLISNESFSCVFTNMESKAIFNLSMIDNVCVNENVSFVLRNTSLIQLSFKVLSEGHLPPVAFTSTSRLTIFNCSKYTRCYSCQHAIGCGWCVYDYKCTGNRSACREPNHWRTASQQHIHTCPVLRKPLGGQYLQPVGVNKSLLLSTQYLPPPLAGCKYICRVKIFGKETLVIDVEAKYVASFMNVSCQFKAEQTRQLLQMSSGVRGAHLSLIYINNNGTKKEEIEFIRNSDDDMFQMDSVINSSLNSELSSIEQADMLLYDCGQLGTSCSTCMSLRLRPEGFACGWCSSSSCTISEECDGNFFIQNLSGRFCPLPIIQSVHPLNGPIQGGTIVTITGNDLGIGLNSIDGIMFGDYPCIIIPSEYQPGHLIKCTTSAASKVQSENAIINIIVNRGDSEQVTATPIFEFSYMNPVVTKIFPRFGPIGGGTMVSIEGSSLNIGNDDSTAITLAGQKCYIRSKISQKIACITSPNEVGEGFVHISIDGTNIIEGSFLYLPNPSIQSVAPAYVIESGGVTVLFTGTSLNSTLNPKLVVFENQVEYIGSCIGISSTALECISPALTTQGFKRATSGTSRHDLLNYTVIMDNIPRLDNTNPILALHAVSDPVFTEIEKSDRQYVRGSHEYISILGENINHVQLSEILIFVDSVPCLSIIYSQNVIRCKPPTSMGSSTQAYHALVKVKLRNGSLEYVVGILEYIQDTSSTNMAEMIAIAMGSVAGLIITLFLASILGLCGFLLQKYCSKRDVEEVPSTISVPNTQQEFVRPEYDYVSHENVYEDINDITIGTGSELQGINMKNGSNEHYQNFAQPNPRNNQEITNEDYIQMEAHSLIRLGAIAEQPRLAVGTQSNQRGDLLRNNPRQQNFVRRGRVVRNSVPEQAVAGAEPDTNQIASGEYVAMLPPSAIQGPPRSSNPAEYCSGENIARPMVSANAESDENENNIPLTKLRCSSDV